MRRPLSLRLSLATCCLAPSRSFNVLLEDDEQMAGCRSAQRDHFEIDAVPVAVAANRDAFPADRTVLPARRLNGTAQRKQQTLAGHFQDAEIGFTRCRFQEMS